MLLLGLVVFILLVIGTSIFDQMVVCDGIVVIAKLEQAAQKNLHGLSLSLSSGQERFRRSIARRHFDGLTNLYHRC